MASQTDQLQILKATLLTACLLCFGFHPALADKRVALVIGNATYQNVPKLGNPLNDGELVSDALKNAGFESVELRRDLKGNAMRRAIRDFSDTAHDADIAIIYFAGHGIEIDGINYLIPVDAALERDIDAFDEAIPLDRLLTVIDPAKRLRLVILDACRDNPFAKSMRRTIAARGGGRGLAKIEPGSPNTLVAFAAKAGSTAEDGNGKNSPFTAALVKYLTRPGLDIRRAFGFARDEVLSATNNRQEPFIYGSLGGEDFPLVPAVTKPATADTTQAVRQDYELAERIGTVEAWDSFLSTYSDGFYAKLAQAQRNKVIAEQARLAAVEQSRQVEEERAKLAAEGARASALAKAAADANSAKDAGIAAERQKVIEEARIAEAARAKQGGRRGADRGREEEGRGQGKGGRGGTHPAVARSETGGGKAACGGECRGSRRSEGNARSPDTGEGQGTCRGRRRGNRARQGRSRGQGGGAESAGSEGGGSKGSHGVGKARPSGCGGYQSATDRPTRHACATRRKYWCDSAKRDHRARAAERIAPGRLRGRSGQQDLGRACAERPASVQQERRDQIRCQRREHRSVGSSSRQIRPDLSADLWTWLQGGRGFPRQDRLQGRLRTQWRR
jgi:uncharacterized caspase-like protein